MKQLLVIGLLIVLFPACKQASKKNSQPGCNKALPTAYATSTPMGSGGYYGSPAPSYSPSTFLTQTLATPTPLTTTTQTVRSIINAQCVSCHRVGGSRSSSDLTQEAVVKQMASTIVTRVNPSATTGRMPPSPAAALTPEQFAIFQAWQAAGATTLDFPTNPTTGTTYPSSQPYGYPSPTPC